MYNCGTGEVRSSEEQEQVHVCGNMKMRVVVGGDGWSNKNK
jgi:hypothetical protein